MSRPIWQLLAMLVALLAAIGIAILLWDPISVAFSHNPMLNTGILVVLLLGILFTIWQVLRLYSDIAWIEDYRTGGFAQSYAQPRLLAPMAAMLKDKTGRLHLNASSLRSLLDGIQSRLDDSREISRYVTSLLIFLGLLGTFWGLLGTVKGVADAITNLQVSGGQDPTVMFDTLKQSLAKPLGGMGIAFSSSLFGLAGSLIIGFMELQASQAQNRFFNELEDWLSGQTRLTSGGTGAFADAGDQPIPAYIQALLEQNAESINELQRVLQRGEEGRGGTAQGFKQLADQLAALNDQLRSQQQVTARLAELASSGGFGIDANSRNHLRNLDAHLTRLSDELAQGRNQSIQDIRAEIKLLARTIAAAASSER
ncbi:flagellar motor protein MotA [Dongia sp.]|uniref:flagellar motor protein MotA n=1 Tax=Dongia sp. TaxID=1977262 RepID=UPI0035B18670